MPRPYEMVLAIAMSGAAAIALVFWFRILFFAWKTIANRRDGVHLVRDAPLGNPANILLKAELLTEKGIAYRRRMVASLLVFVAIVVGGFVVAAIVGVVAGITSR
jgi:ABC-type nitrate/sulfonate/bicarbonate transport system permease component